MSLAHVLAVAGLAVAGYLIGAVNPASLIARWRGVDLRATGSGNPGATNAGRALGRGWGVVVGVADVLKGYLPTVLVYAVYGLAAACVVGLAAVLGHVTSPYLKGRGGKGVATSFGVVLAIQPWWALALLAAFGIVVALLRFVGAGSVAAAVTLAVLGLTVPPGTGGAAWAARGWALATALIVLARHRTNLVSRWRAWRRLRTGDPLG